MVFLYLYYSIFLTKVKIYNSKIKIFRLYNFCIAIFNCCGILCEKTERKISKMGKTWMSLDDFFDNESKCRHGAVNRTNYDIICGRYGFVQGANGWVGTQKYKTKPNVRNVPLHRNAPRITQFFDHFYSFKDLNGDVYWVVCPYDCGLTTEQIVEAFRKNYVICDIITNSFYADYAIIIKPENMMNACIDYDICQTDTGKFALYKTTMASYDNIICVGTYNSEVEAERVKLEQFMQILQNQTKAY